MRIRHKPWARPELESCSFYVASPSELRGRWADEFGNGQPLHMELGCGKGGFIADMAAQHPAVNFLAIDLKSEMLVLAKRNLEAKDAHASAHVRLMSQDIERIGQMLAPEDKIERIYINFCPPWPKERDKKHRLTHPRQLNQYRLFLQEGGEIWFKTDDDGLFEESLRYFDQCSFEVCYQTWDLAKSGFPASAPTEHEEMFTRMGKKIKFLIAVADHTGHSVSFSSAE